MNENIYILWLALLFAEKHEMKLKVSVDGRGTSSTTTVEFYGPDPTGKTKKEKLYSVCSGDWPFAFLWAIDLTSRAILNIEMERNQSQFNAELGQKLKGIIEGSTAQTFEFDMASDKPREEMLAFLLK